MDYFVIRIDEVIKVSGFIINFLVILYYRYIFMYVYLFNEVLEKCRDYVGNFMSVC